jgi:hypothetical protein
VPAVRLCSSFSMTRKVIQPTLLPLHNYIFHKLLPLIPLQCNVNIYLYVIYISSYIIHLYIPGNYFYWITHLSLCSFIFQKLCIPETMHMNHVEVLDCRMHLINILYQLTWITDLAHVVKARSGIKLLVYLWNKIDLGTIISDQPALCFLLFDSAFILEIFISYFKYQCCNYMWEHNKYQRCVLETQKVIKDIGVSWKDQTNTEIHQHVECCPLTCKQCIPWCVQKSLKWFVCS